MFKKIFHLSTDSLGGSKKQREIVSQVAQEEDMDYVELERLLLINKYETGKLLDYSLDDIRSLVRRDPFDSPWEEEPLVDEDEFDPLIGHF